MLLTTRTPPSEIPIPLGNTTDIVFFLWRSISLHTQPGGTLNCTESAVMKLSLLYLFVLPWKIKTQFPLFAFFLLAWHTNKTFSRKISGRMPRTQHLAPCSPALMAPIHPSTSTFFMFTRNESRPSTLHPHTNNPIVWRNELFAFLPHRLNERLQEIVL